MIRKLAIASIILGESILALFIANLIVDHGYKDEPSRDLGSIMIALTLGFTFLGIILFVTIPTVGRIIKEFRKADKEKK